MKFEKNQKALTLALFFLLILASPLTVEAYLDPGTGSLIIQAVIAAVAAIGLYIGIFWRKIRAFFSKKKEEKKDKAEEDIKKADEDRKE